MLKSIWRRGQHQSIGAHILSMKYLAHVFKGVNLVGVATIVAISMLLTTAVLAQTPTPIATPPPDCSNGDCPTPPPDCSNGDCPTPTPAITHTPTATLTPTPIPSPDITPGPSATPVPTFEAPVGGVVVPIDRTGSMIGWLIVVMLITVAGVSLAVWNKRRKNRIPESS